MLSYFDCGVLSQKIPTYLHSVEHPLSVKTYLIQPFFLHCLKITTLFFTVVL